MLKEDPEAFFREKIFSTEKQRNGIEIRFFLNREKPVIIKPQFLEYLIDRLMNYETAGEVLNLNSRNTIKIFQVKVSETKELAVKRFGQHGLYDNLRFRFIKSRALRSFRISLMLNKLGINVPVPFGAVEFRGSKNKLINSHYLYLKENFDFNLYDIYRENFSDSFKNRVVIRLAEKVRKIHDAGIFYSDLQPKNIQLKLSSEDDFEIYLIDFNRAKIRENLSLKKRARDLYKLRIHEHDENLFLLHYSDDVERLEKYIQRNHKKSRFKKSLKKFFNF